jgi:hypothetical protein
MSSLSFGSTIAALPKAVFIAAGTVFVLLLVVVWALNRRRYVVIGESEPFRMAVIQLGRIADSLERLSLNLAAETKAPAEEKETRSAFPILHR